MSTTRRRAGRRVRTGILSATLLALGVGTDPARAVGEYLVRDFGQAHRFEFVDAVTPFVVVVDEVAYFYRHDGIHGHELWRSDGTALGTYLLQDVCPGICGSESISAPVGFRVAAGQGQIFFAANDGVHGTELWVTDGTAAGTRLVRDVRPGPATSEIASLGVAGGILYFGADDGVHGHELWRSDGTEAGTWLVADLAPGATHTWITSIDAGAGVVFVRGPNELWSSDGTAAGTQLLHDLVQGSYSSATRGGSYTVLPNGIAVFQACTPIGTAYDCELWRSDGTAAGTMLLADLYPGSASSQPAGFESGNGEIWFTARVPAPGSEPTRLFRTDGTVAGTVEVPVPSDVEVSTYWGQGAVVGSRFFFTGRDAVHGAEPWVTDGVTTELVADVNPGTDWSISTLYLDRPNFVDVGGALVFVAQDAANGWRLWRSEGTAATTLPISDFDGAPENAWFGGYQALARPPVVDGRLLLSIFRSDRGLELWSSDGSAPGTARIRTLGDSTSAFVHATRSFYSFGEIRCAAAWRQGLMVAPLTGPNDADGGWYFVDGVPGEGELLASWNLGVYSNPECASSDGQALAVLGTEQGRAVWRTDGTAVGTTELFEFGDDEFVQSVPGFGRFGGAMFFSVGSNRVVRADPEASAVELPSALGYGEFEATEQLYFGGFDGLEVSDGFSEPLLLLDAFEVDDMTVVGSTLFFSVRSTEEGTELWRTDGSLEGTVSVRDLNPGPAGGLPDRTIAEVYAYRAPESRLAAFDEQDVLFVGNDGTTGFELWTSDGTEEGTVVAADIVPGPGGSWPRHLVSLGNGIVLFAAEHPTFGYELFRTDGTTAGTSVVRDLVTGVGSSVPDDFVVQDGVLYFSAWTREHGREAWRSDGTAAGTYRLTDVAPGPLSSSPSRFVRRGNRLFFTATDHVHGFELWARADDGSIPIFIDGFETGDAGRWSAQIP